jgi:DUF4097 and DUF4098 domain-containing protein YvlB
MVLWVLVTALLAAPAAVAGSRIERDLELSAGGSFTLDTDSGSVRVTGGSGSKARVVITAHRDDIEDLYDIEFASDGAEVRVTVDKKSKASSWFGWTRGAGLHFEIEVPARVELSIDTSGGSITAEGIQGEVLLDTSGGSITAQDIQGDLDADTSGGSISIEQVVGDVVADTSGGSIDISNVRGEVVADTSGGGIRIEEVSGDIRADTSGGTIRIREAGGRVQADTSGGGVTASFTPGNSSGGSLSSSGGGVSVELDPAVNLKIDATSSGGPVICDIPITVRGRVSKSNLQGEIGSGGATLRLRSSGGSIHIDPL